MHKTAKVGKSSLAQVCPKVLRQVLGEPWSKGVYTRLFYHRPFLSISFVTRVQPWQPHTADVLSEQLFICLFRHPSGDLSVAF